MNAENHAPPESPVEADRYFSDEHKAVNFMAAHLEPGTKVLTDAHAY